MKKISVVLGIALAASFCHAAAVAWGSGAIKDKDGATITSGYTAVCYFYSDAGGSALITSSTDTTASKGAFSGETADSFTAGTVYYTKLVITSNDNKFSLTSDLASFTLPDTGNSSLNFVNGAGFDTVSAKISSSNWTAVPEPTSFGLVLLGIAGLALKRKIA